MSFADLDDAAAQHLCLFGAAGAFCSEPATVHIIGDDGSFTMGCSKHARWWDGRPFEDCHLIGSDCGMPGTHWLGSTPEWTGTCRLLFDTYPDGAS